MKRLVIGFVINFRSLSLGDNESTTLGISQTRELVEGEMTSGLQYERYGPNEKGNELSLPKEPLQEASLPEFGLP